MGVLGLGALGLWGLTWENKDGPKEWALGCENAMLSLSD